MTIYLLGTKTRPVWHGGNPLPICNISTIHLLCILALTTYKTHNNTFFFFFFLECCCCARYVDNCFKQTKDPKCLPFVKKPFLCIYIYIITIII